MQAIGIKAWRFLSAAPYGSLLVLHYSAFLTAPLPRCGSPMACEGAFAVGGLILKLAYTSLSQTCRESEMDIHRLTQ